MSETVPAEAPLSDLLGQPIGHLHSDGAFCQDRAVDAPVWWPVSLYTEDQLRAAVAAERERIISALPGGHSVDPQWVADMVRWPERA